MGGPLTDELRLQRRCEAAVQETFASLADLATNEVLVNLSQVVGEINGHVEHGAPWTLAKDGRVTTSWRLACWLRAGACGL